jgi:hypothetical protein
MKWHCKTTKVKGKLNYHCLRHEGVCGSRGITPFILIMGTRRRRVVKFTLTPLYNRRMRVRYLLTRRLGGPEHRFSRFGGKKSLPFLSQIETRPSSSRVSEAWRTPYFDWMVYVHHPIKYQHILVVITYTYITSYSVITSWKELNILCRYKRVLF